MQNNIICAGFGGQGVLTAGMILINVGVKYDYNVTWTSSYGSEMRGGTASCSVVICDEEIGTPYFTDIDDLICMNSPSVEKYEKQVKPGGKLFLNTSIVEESMPTRDDIEIYGVDATEIANNMKNPRGANIAMLGAVINASGIFGKQEFLDGMNEFFDKKGKNTPLNGKCFVDAFESVRKLK